jgi:predicted  nucleic acid-binding Zn-ribbon protein
MLQKLEADIRGHIRLEHEMKIHLDYLEGRVEELENTNLKVTSEKKSLTKKLKDLEEKLKTASDEAEKVDKRHREAVERLERDLKEVASKIHRQKQDNMSTVEYTGEESTVLDQYKKIQSNGLNSG